MSATRNAEQRNGLKLGNPGWRDYVSATVNKEQLNRRTQGKLGLHKTVRLTGEEGNLKDSLSLSELTCQH